MKIKRLFIKLISIVVFFCYLIFHRVPLYDASNYKNYVQCAVFWNKYKHTQKSVVSWSGYSAYRSFLYIAEKKFLIPGIDEGFVPQGITFCEQLNSFVISGYSYFGGAAYIITVDANSGRINGEYEIRKSDGSVFTGHSGGIASYGKYIYITDGYVLYYASVFDLNNKSSILKIHGEIILPSSASFISTYDGYLWAGNFYHKSFGSKYDVSSIDKYNKEYRTIITGYRFDASQKGGIRTLSDNISQTAVPYIAVCAPDEVQGIAFLDNGDIHLSCSYGRKIMSSQLRYSYPLDENNDSFISIGGKKVPIWYLNNDRLISAINAPPMSEGAVSRDGNVYVIFESASKKYKNTALDPTDCVWKIKRK